MKTKFPTIPFILSLILLLASCAVFIFLHGKINSNRRIAEGLRKELIAEEEKKENMKALEAAFLSIEKERTLLDNHFARSSDPVPFLDTIEKLGRDAGTKAEVTLVNLSQDKSNLFVDIKADGTFSAVYKYLLLLENSPYELEFTSMEMKNGAVTSAEGKTLSSAQWAATFRVKVLSFLP